MRAKIVGDLSHLPASGFGHHSLWFWAGAGFMLIEGAGFAMALAAYLYVMAGADQWPLAGVAPDLMWGTLNTLLLAASLLPNAAVSKAARRRDLPGVQFWSLVMALTAVATLALRGLEFTALNTRWDQDAYGSIVWMLILLHTVHLATDFIDTAFLTVFLRTHPVDNERFADTDDNAGYWAFIVLAWLPIYALLYWAPRWAP